MTWAFASNLLTAFLGSGAALAFLKIFFEHRKDRQERADTAKYLAIQLTFLFEGYAIECADKVSDHRTANDSAGAAGRRIGGIPPLSPLPESGGYKLLDRSILNDVLDFPQRCQMAQRSAIFWWDVVGDDECCNEAMEENTLRMGGRAVEIAKKLRREYALGPRELTFGEWNIEEFFLKELSKLKQKEAKRQEQ